MINQLLQELKETWGYTTEELNDIREKMEELSNSAFWEGYNERSEDIRLLDIGWGINSYGKKEDFE
jgi:hypothetical protein